MGSGRSGLRHRMVLLAALPFALAGFVSAPASASDQGPPATSVEGAEQESSSGPGTAPPSEPAADQPVTTEESSGAGPSGAEPVTTDSTTEPEVQQPVAEQPVDTDSPGAPEPGAAVPSAAPRQAAGDRPARVIGRAKVTICHRTRSRLNPYNQITIAESAIITRGHSGHTGPIFAPGVEQWGDIIPPAPPEFPGGMNWPEGQSVLDNGCEVRPDVGPLPSAEIGAVECVGTNPQLDVTVANGADATAPAIFTILVDGVVVETVGPLAPGESQTVTLTGDPGGGLDGQENQTFTVEVRSGGEVIATQVITVDCPPPPPDVELSAELVCLGEVARGSVTVTNNGQQPVEVTAAVDGTPVGTPLIVEPGATETATADVSQFEDQTVTVDILVDGVVEATYTVTTDCVAPVPEPGGSVAGQECPPPSSTVTMGNTGEVDSEVEFVILVNGKVVQDSAPLFGGEATTIVADLSRFEDQTVIVQLRSRGEVLASRTIHVNCVVVAGAGAGAGAAAGGSGSSVQPGLATGSGVLPSVGAGFGPGVIGLGLGFVVVGSLVIVAGSHRSGPRSRRA